MINSVPAGYGDTGLAVDAFVYPSAQRKSVVNRVKYTFFYSYPKEINITYPAIQYKPGEPSSSAVKTTIKIEGTLTDPLFRSKKFSGNIEIGTFEFTKTYKLMDIDFNGLLPLLKITRQQ